MAIVPQLLDYTDKDYASLKRRLRNLIRSVFPEWTDFNVANFGNLLTELMAHVGDILLFYQDGQARNSRIVTASQRRAILGLVKLIGFSPSTATMASADLAITIPVATAGDVVFPAGTFVRTEQVTAPIRYQTTEEVVIPAGQTSAPLVTAVNGELKQEQLVFTGLPNQRVKLRSTPFVEGTLVLSDENGVFEAVDNFLDSTSDDRHYVIEVDENDSAILTFGNGVNGAAPSGLGLAEHRVGGGSAGRVEMNKLRVFEETSWSDSLGNSVTPSVTNPAASSGGTDRQTVQQIKERAPATVRALTRCVTREDFEINTLRLTDVSRCIMLTQNEDPSVAENAGDLYIVPAGGGLPTEDLKAKALDQVTNVYPCTLTFRVNVRDPLYREVDVSMVVFFSAGAIRASVAALIRQNLATFFEPENPDGTTNTEIDFGGNVKDSDGNIVSELEISSVFNVVRDTAGVRKLPLTDFFLNGLNDDVSLARKEFPILGTVSIIDGDTGAAL